MGKHDIKVVEVVVVDGAPVVRGTIGEVGFEASSKRWGSKMLMNVVAEGLDRGQRVAIGQAAKSALRQMEIALPKAELVRPRKPKDAAVEAVEVGEPLEMGDLR